MTPEEDEVLTLVLRPTSDDPDLVLEAYVGGNESTTVTVQAGQPVYIKVLGFGSGTTGGYRLSSSLIR